MQKFIVYCKTYWATSSFGAYKLLSDDTKSKVSEVLLTSNNVVRDILGHFSWLLFPVLAGLGMTVLTWCMIYVDSYIPGIKPPTPFSPAKNRWVCWRVALLFNVSQEVSKGSKNSQFNFFLSPKWKKAHCHLGIAYEFQISSKFDFCCITSANKAKAHEQS